MFHRSPKQKQKSIERHIVGNRLNGAGVLKAYQYMIDLERGLEETFRGLSKRLDALEENSDFLMDSMATRAEEVEALQDACRQQEAQLAHHREQFGATAEAVNQIIQTIESFDDDEEEEHYEN